MNCIPIRLAVMGCLMAAGVVTVAQPRTYTVDEVNTLIWAKVANERAKAGTTRSSLNAAGRGWQDDQDRECGVLEIGNVNTGGNRVGGPREVNTIVLGDVLNIAGRCK